MLTKILGNLDWRHWVLSHLVWIVAISVALLAGRAALQEHDARVLADATVKASQVNIVQLQQQIAAANAAAAQQIAAIEKVVKSARTPTQQIAAIPQLSNVPLNAREVPSLQPNGPPQVAVDLAPLVQELGQCKEDAVQLNTCQANLKSEQDIESQQKTEITALRKKPSLIHRVGEAMKMIGIGVGIGLLLGAHGL